MEENNPKGLNPPDNLIPETVSYDLDEDRPSLTPSSQILPCHPSLAHKSF